ncbi:MAG: VapC toxin family PIN domain ribonuclease, partial [Thermoprotei archaeon]
MKELLFDASSMIRAIKERRVDLLIKGNIQPLTIYEVLNAFWKEAYLIRTISKEAAIKATTLISELIKEMKILTITGLEKEIIELALNLGLTVYD